MFFAIFPHRLGFVGVGLLFSHAHSFVSRTTIRKLHMYWLANLNVAGKHEIGLHMALTDTDFPLLGVKRTWRLQCEMSALDPKRTYRFGIYCLSHTLRESSNKRSAFAIRPRVSVMLSRVLRIISQISFSTFMDAERYRLKCSIASVMAGSIACSLLR